MAFDSRDALMATPMEDFEEAPTLPAGHYYGQIVRYETTTVGERNTDVLDYYCQLTEPGEDTVVSSSGIDLREYELRARFFITKRAMYRLRNFHESLGFSPKLTADAVVPETIGMKVFMSVSQSPGRNNRMYNNIDEIAGAK